MYVELLLFLAALTDEKVSFGGYGTEDSSQTIVHSYCQ